MALITVATEDGDITLSLQVDASSVIWTRTTSPVLKSEEQRDIAAAVVEAITSEQKSAAR